MFRLISVDVAIALRPLGLAIVTFALGRLTIIIGLLRTHNPPPPFFSAYSFELKATLSYFLGRWIRVTIIKSVELQICQRCPEKICRVIVKNVLRTLCALGAMIFVQELR